MLNRIVFLISLFVFIAACKKSDDIFEEGKMADFNYTFSEGGDVKMLSPVLPHIYINIDNNEEVEEKEKYLEGDLIIDGKDSYEDYEGKLEIRGRGNSTWGFPKKPYRLKLNTKSEILGLPSSRHWILLSEYLDGSMLYNSVPFAAAHLLGLPYTHNVIPVEVTINGIDRGVYAFMEHKEVATNRIDIGDDGILLEIDSYFDEDWKFTSSYFNLPVTIQHPEDNMSKIKVAQIKHDFEKFEKLLAGSSFPNNNYHKYFDIPSFVNYFIVYDLTMNQEIAHPKSTYVNKLKGGKYRMGIIWDFDWGFGYTYSSQHFDMNAVNNPLLPEEFKMPGALFFKRVMEDSRVRKMYAERWQWFRNNKYAQLKQYILSYAETIRFGYENDHSIWGKRTSSGDLDTDIYRLNSWLDARAEYMDAQAIKFLQE